MQQSQRDSGHEPDRAFDGPILDCASGLIVQDGKVLLIQRGKDPYKGYWSLPSGGIEPGERLRDTVKREVLEETGLVVEVSVIAGYREEVEPGNYYVIPAFFCRIIGGELRAGDDAAAVECVDPSEIAQRPIVPALLDVFRDAGLLPARQ